MAQLKTLDSLHNMPPKAPNPSKRLKIGVVGLGRMGKRHVKTLLYRTPGAELVAVCTVSETELTWARDFFSEGTTVYDSYDAMLAHPGLEAVWVATSTDKHASQSIAAIDKGMHVLCEKPLSTSLEEVRGRNSRCWCWGTGKADIWM